VHPGNRAHDHAASDALRYKLLHSMMRPEAWPVWLASAGVRRETTGPDITLANMAWCLQAAEQGLGVAMIQTAYVGDDVRRGPLVVAFDHIARTGGGHYLVCESRAATAPPISTFRDWIRSVVER
jgi:DNA-binding transcriptional LysR family regulator